MTGPSPLHGFLRSTPHLWADSDAHRLDALWKRFLETSLPPSPDFFFSYPGVGGERKIAPRFSELVGPSAAAPTWLTCLERPRQEQGAGRVSGLGPPSHQRTARA